MGGNASWIVFLVWGAFGMFVARVFFTAPFDRKKLPWMKAVGEREAGGPWRVVAS
jgi:hypothetical protein